MNAQYIIAFSFGFGSDWQWEWCFNLYYSEDKWKTKWESDTKTRDWKWETLAWYFPTEQEVCWETLLNRHISLKCAEGMWPQPENEDAEFSCETNSIWSPVCLWMWLGIFSHLASQCITLLKVQANATLYRLLEKRRSENLSVLRAPDFWLCWKITLV